MIRDFQRRLLGGRIVGDQVLQPCEKKEHLKNREVTEWVIGCLDSLTVASLLTTKLNCGSCIFSSCAPRKALALCGVAEKLEAKEKYEILDLASPS